MAIIPSAPSPTRLAEGWEERFGPVLRRIAGRDGVVTHAAIDRLAEETNTDAAAADNAKAILTASGQQSMRVDKMLKLIGAANTVGAERATGHTRRASWRGHRPLGLSGGSVSLHRDTSSQPLGWPVYIRGNSHVDAASVPRRRTPKLRRRTSAILPAARNVRCPRAPCENYPSPY
jgi:hypothetical protein